ncbi:MAG: hypothetical protein AAGH78_05830 [Cyanobacteria bacterium P01_H01_bin.58]
MNELHDLIRQQASYSTLVNWLQQREHCPYRDACMRLNEELAKYRSHYASMQ